MLFPLFAVLALAPAAVPAMPTLAVRSSNGTIETNTTCTAENMETRIEWANMNSSDQQSYLKAVKCLMGRPAQTGIAGTKTRFDDMNAMHQVQSKVIHIVAQFLPFHRLYVHVYMQLLRDECGYTGPTPWWDETRDAGNFMASPLLDPVTGFGGNGSSTDLCVRDGPFANTTLHIGPGYTNVDHCLSRKVNEANSTLASPSYVEANYNVTTYKEFWENTGYTTHGAGHSGVGGDMENIVSSPGEPLFYLHHGWIDRLWRQWQEADLENRLYQLGGPSVQAEGDETVPETTLDYVMTLYEIRPNATVRQVMDTQGGFLCYKYDY